jgi:hypothetical protein
MDAHTLIEARKKAELAVAEMPEGELRIEAFKLILNRLLMDGGSPTPVGKGPAIRHQRSENRKTKQHTEHQEDRVPRSTPSRVLELKAEGFFDAQRGIGEIREELQTHGWRYGLTDLSGPLMKLVRERELRRTKVKDGNKTTYKYFNP